MAPNWRSTYLKHRFFEECLSIVREFVANQYQACIHPAVQHQLVSLDTLECCRKLDGLNVDELGSKFKTCEKNKGDNYCYWLPLQPSRHGRPSHLHYRPLPAF